MRWYLAHVLQTTNATTRTYVIRGNSIFNPDVLGTSTYPAHQPTTYDQWVTFYASYYVAASKINVRYIREDSLLPSVKLQVWPDRDPAAGLLTNPIMEEQPHVKYRLVAQKPVRSCEGRIKNYMTTSKMFGLKTQFEDDYSATYLNNPFQMWYWIIRMKDDLGSTGATTMHIGITMTYYVMWKDKVRHIGAS